MTTVKSTPTWFTPPSSSIVAPKRTTLGQAYNSVQSTGILPKYTPLAGMDQSYYDNLYNSSAKRMRENYFDNNNSMSNQLTTQMNKRGLLGSGIEAGATTDLYKSFGDDMVDLESNINSEKAKNDLDINKFNINNQNTLAQLGLSAAGDEARNATTFDTSMFEQEVNLEKTKADQLSSAIEQLTSLAGNRDVDELDRRSSLAGVYDYLKSIGVSIPGVNDGQTAQETSAAAAAPPPITPNKTYSNGAYLYPGRGYTKDGVHFYNNPKDVR
jgi:hypothetical protein